VIYLLVFASSGLLTWWFASIRSPFQIHDRPNERSLHDHPVPRSGGIAILLGIVAGWIWLLATQDIPEPLPWMMAAAGLVAVVSLFDDLYKLSARMRLSVHMLAAILLLLGDTALPWGWMGWMISSLGIIWMLNLYNFMDGMDGFASGMTVAGFSFLGLAGWLGDAQVYAFYCWVVAIAALGFLLFNFPPARIFMGDMGSATLGLLVAGFSLWGIRVNLFPLWFPLFVFSPFVVDATVTLIRRALRKEKIWQAHRIHYYQRLVQSGWGHRKTVLIEYVLILGVGISAIVLLLYPEWRTTGLISWCVIFILLAYAVDHHCSKQQGETG